MLRGWVWLGVCRGYSTRVIVGASSIVETLSLCACTWRSKQAGRHSQIDEVDSWNEMT